MKKRNLVLVIVLLVIYFTIAGFFTYFNVCGSIQYSPEAEAKQIDLQTFTELEKIGANIEIIGVGREALVNYLESSDDFLASARLNSISNSPDLFENVAIVTGLDKTTPMKPSVAIFDKCRWGWIRIPFTDYAIPSCYDYHQSCKYWAGGWPWYASCKQNGLLPIGCLCTASFGALP